MRTSAPRIGRSSAREPKLRFAEASDIGTATHTAHSATASVRQRDKRSIPLFFSERLRG